MIKERIVQLIEFKGFPKEKFFSEIGVTSSNFRSKARSTPVNSDTIANIFAKIPDVNLEWLITGKGEMLRQNSEKNDDERVPMVKIPADVWETMRDTMQLQTASIKEKDEQISKLIEMLKGELTGMSVLSNKRK